MAAKSRSPRRRISEPEARAGLNPLLQKGEAVGMPVLIEMLRNRLEIIFFTDIIVPKPCRLLLYDNRLDSSGRSFFFGNSSTIR